MKYTELGPGDLPHWNDPRNEVPWPEFECKGCEEMTEYNPAAYGGEPELCEDCASAGRICEKCGEYYEPTDYDRFTCDECADLTTEGRE